MKVSVVIPCYNAEPYIAQAIGSALDQTHPPHEIIVVDDGSTDGSLAVARRFAAGGECRVVSERSGQAARTRNIGAALASGDALMFLDADDVLAPDTLAGLVGALPRQPDGIAICPWYRLDRVVDRWVQRPPSRAPRRGGQDPLSGWLTGWYHPPCSVLWSREAFERAGRWDERWNPNDDSDLVMRALVFGVPLAASRTGAGYYRRLPAEASSLSSKRYSRDGVMARFHTLRKITCLLDERGRLNRHRAAVSEAIRIIAASAGNAPSLAGELDRFAQQYAPPSRLWLEQGRRWLAGERRRLQGAIVRRWRAPAAALGWRWPPASPSVQPEEISHGLSRAAAAMERSPTGPAARLEVFAAPAVSVIIPTYNRAHLLPRALRSVLEQTFTDFEVLVVDDGSTDDTRSVMDACHDPRVRYLPQRENRGVGAARNHGLRGSRGGLIAFLDSDDEWLPEKLARQVALFHERDDDVGLVCTGVESVFGDGTRRIDVPSRRGTVYREMLQKNVIHGTSSVMIRRNVVANVGFFDETFPAIEDYDYWLRVTRFFRVDFLPDALIRYYDARGQYAGTERKSLAVRDNLDAHWRLYRKHRREIRRAGVVHLVHLKTARRYLASSQGDLWGARRFALRAVLASPTSIEAHRMLRRTVLPSGLRWMLRKGWQAVHGPSRI